MKYIDILKGFDIMKVINHNVFSFFLKKALELLFKSYKVA